MNANKPDKPQWYYAPRVFREKPSKPAEPAEKHITGHVEEPAEGEAPQFYGVYRRDKEGLSEWVADFIDETHAKAFVDAQNGVAPIPTVVVGLEGGLIQWGVADLPVNLVKLDMDTEGCDPDSEIVSVTSRDGDDLKVTTWSGQMSVEIDQDWVTEVIGELDQAMTAADQVTGESPAP